MSKPIPIRAIITTICLNVFSHTESCYFSEIHARVSQTCNVSDHFLAQTIESIGFKVDRLAQPWIVRA
jgi:hypothetical protein